MSLAQLVERSFDASDRVIDRLKKANIELAQENTKLRNDLFKARATINQLNRERQADFEYIDYGRDG